MTHSFWPNCDLGRLSHLERRRFQLPVLNHVAIRIEDPRHPAVRRSQAAAPFSTFGSNNHRDFDLAFASGDLDADAVLVALQQQVDATSGDGEALDPQPIDEGGQAW